MINIEAMTPEQLEEAIADAVALIDHFNAIGLAGTRKAFPLTLYEALYRAVPSAVDEAYIFDDEGYWLHRRPTNDHLFGPNRLHLLGGSARPGPFARPNDNMLDMARKEMGFEGLEYVAGPIATYQWIKDVDHPSGWPRSEVRLYRAVGRLPIRPDVVKYPHGQLPDLADMITNRSGIIHRKFIEVSQAALWSASYNCVDLNANWE